MKLQAKIWLGAGIVIAAIMALDLAWGYRRIESDIRERLDNDARIVRAMLMATRRVYHEQFMASGVPVDEHTVGFLPAHALSRISADFPNWIKSGLRFNNVSDRPRNPGNRADADELAAMDWFRSHPSEPDHIAEIRDARGATYYHFTAPIWIEPYCLKCHGEREAAPPSIRDAYDAAYGYKVGELRGVMSIKLPLDELQARTRAEWWKRFGVRAGGYAVLLVLLGILMYRLVIRPLACLEGVARRFGAGDLDVRAEVSGDDEVASLARTFNDMAEAVSQHEVQVARLNQIYAALSETNQAIVRMDDEAILLDRICRIAVDYGGVRMAWIGRADEAAGCVAVVTAFGAGTDYLDGIRLPLDAAVPGGDAPAAKAWRSGQPVIIQDFLADPSTEPWHDRARPYGWRASAAFPIRRGGSVHLVLVLYDAHHHAFDAKMTDLLAEMAMDIGYALERNDAEARIQRLSHFDTLTSLPNRAFFADRVAQAIAQAQRSGQPLALMFLDLDHFKRINDTLGHRIGDQLLVGLSQRFLELLRAEDTVSRLGGDEFLILLPHADAAHAAHVAERLLAAVAMPLRVEDAELTVTPSIGIALYPADGEDFGTLLRHADTATNRAKQEGRNAYRFFTLEMQQRSTRTLHLEAALRRALERDELVLHYQPQVALENNAVFGVEALVRWRHPELGLISPAEFIPIAESSGLILPIGEWVLRTALRQLAAWQGEGLPIQSMAVNLSAVQFRQQDLPAVVDRLLAEVSLPPSCLELELTESVTMEDPVAAIAMIDALHGRGIQIAIDDFGTGYSSLNYLKRFRVDKLKIDQSFVRDLATDPEDEAIVQAIISLARTLKFDTIAEGVETAAQLSFLQANGCHQVQGFLFSRPLPAEELAEWVRARCMQPD